MGKQSCAMDLTTGGLFDQKCQDEISARYEGTSENGPTHAYGLVLCKRGTFAVLSVWPAADNEA